MQLQEHDLAAPIAVSVNQNPSHAGPGNSCKLAVIGNRGLMIEEPIRNNKPGKIWNKGEAHVRLGFPGGIKQYGFLSRSTNNS